MGDDRIQDRNAADRAGVTGHPSPEPMLPAPSGEGSTFAELPCYPDCGPELPPRGKADWLWELAEAFAGTLIGAAALGLFGLVCGIIVTIRLLWEGADLLGALHGVGVATLVAAGCGAAFGLYIDSRRAISSHLRGD